jgi:hypothetical protein
MHYRQVYLNHTDPISFMTLVVDTSGHIYDDLPPGDVAPRFRYQDDVVGYATGSKDTSVTVLGNELKLVI